MQDPNGRTICHEYALLGQIEKLLSMPCRLSVGRLRLDPAWDPFRDHPRFQALLKKYEVE
jgi:hypothetical protein